MAISLIITACFLLYLPSKYFPALPVQYQFITLRQVPLRLAALVLWLGAYWLFTYSYDGITAGILVAVFSMLILSVMVISVRFNAKWLYLWLMVWAVSFVFNIH